MKDKLKTHLIHRLGGFTRKDIAEIGRVACHRSQLLTLTEAKRRADSLYGLPPDEWCKRMYDYLTDQIDYVNQKIEQAHEPKGEEA